MVAISKVYIGVAFSTAENLIHVFLVLEFVFFALLITGFADYAWSDFKIFLFMLDTFLAIVYYRRD